MDKEPAIPVHLLGHRTKSLNDARRKLRRLDSSIVVLHLKSGYEVFFKAANFTAIFDLNEENEYERLVSILKSAGFGPDSSEIDMLVSIDKVINAKSISTTNFKNRNVFSTHYLEKRLLDGRNFKIDKLERAWIGNTQQTLDILGWTAIKNDNDDHVFSVKNSVASLVIARHGKDLDIRDTRQDVAPSYKAVRQLRTKPWVILTNGRVWRLYTARVSATTTNYFELDLGIKNKTVLRYLAVMFGASTYLDKDGKADIDVIFERGRELACDIEQSLADRILRPDGIFLNMVKGVLNYNGKKLYSNKKLDDAKNVVLNIMYRIWFLLYAESRELLPITDKRYRSVSLTLLNQRLDGMESTPDKADCWDYIVNLFKKIRNGSPDHNIPQYDGALFKEDVKIDGRTIKNKFFAKAIRGLLEQDGKTIDYSSLGVRHLGNVYETLMEFNVKQAERALILLETKNEVREVETATKSSYIYKKNELYIINKKGSISRKSSGSFYTPDPIVNFLVKRGLEPVFEARRKLIRTDLDRYAKRKTDANRVVCIDRLLDLQVLDPTMGSGHFLVEALNQITQWASDMLSLYPEHPLNDQIDVERTTVIATQKKAGIVVDEHLLTPGALLKRKIMKRCIFGVDINPLAVELARVSLWLDSFAVGTPLTYLNPHIKNGDSTIGVWFEDLEDPKNHTLDNWVVYPKEPSRLIEEIGLNADVTIDQVRDSRIKYEEYVKQIRPHKIMLDALAATKINPDVIPKHAHMDISPYLKRMADAVSGRTRHIERQLEKAIGAIRTMSKKYRFFHWELEMMDAFTDKRKGFDLIVGNPPWDKVRPNKNEFFTAVEPGYKKKSVSERTKIEKIFNDEFQEYKRKFEEQKRFYKAYGRKGENRDFDLWRITMEKALRLLTPGGTFSMLIPSAITNSRSATELRKHILNLNLRSLYVFENTNRIFPIHSGYRFALLSFQNTGGPDKFNAAFYLHSLDILNDIDVHSSGLSKRRINDMSPKMSLIPEIRNQRDYDILQKINLRHPKLRDVRGWSVDLGREMNMAEKKDKKLAVSRGGWPVIESKNFHQHIHNFSLPKYHANIRKTLTRVSTIRKFHGQSKQIHDSPRLVYRSISSSTNTRTMIASMIPRFVFTSINAYMAIPRIGMFEVNSDYHQLNAYLCGVFNSTTYDFLIRLKVDKAVGTCQIYGTPVPENHTSDVAKRIGKLSATLTLAESWNEDMADAFLLIKQDVGDFSLGRRIRTVAEIDALAALCYGLTRDEYEHVLLTFKTNTKSFTDGEMSSRVDYLRMEKYDRDRHMQIFYGHVYKLVLDYYDKLAYKYGTVEDKHEK